MTTSVCESGELIPVDEAIERLLAQAPPPPSTQQVKTAQALGRVLAGDIFSPVNLPAWDNSAMDGYALRAADLPAEGGYLRLAGRIAAGEEAATALGSGQTMRILPAHPCRPGPTPWCPRALPGLWPTHLVPADAHG